MNLGKQVISAGAASTSTFNILALLTAEQRMKLREVMQDSCTIQGAATLADGQAQQAALQKEGDVRQTMAIQSFTESGTTFASEAAGGLIDSHIGNTAEAQLGQRNLKLAEGWESRLNGIKPGDIVIKGEADLSTGHMPGQKPGDVEMKEIKPVVEPPKPLTADEVELELKGIRLKNPEGNFVDPKDLTEKQQAAIDQAVTSGSPTLTKLLKEARKGVKRFRSQTESTGNAQQRKSQQMKDLMRAAGTIGKGGLDFMVKSTQYAEANQKLIESQQRYLSDTNGSVMRQEADAASNLTNHIQNINQARKEMFESNRA